MRSLSLTDQNIVARTNTPPDVAGELIRKDLIDGQLGVSLHLDLQVIDIKTCQPIPQSALEIWGANATVSSLDTEQPSQCIN